MAMQFSAPSEPLQAALPLLITLSSDPAAALASRPLLSSTHVAAYASLLVVPFLVPPFPGRRALFLAAQTLLLVRILQSTTGDRSRDYALGLFSYGLYQRFCDFYWCSGPPEKNPELALKGSDKCFGDLPPLEKLSMVESLYRNLRGSGYKWEVRRRPMRSPLGRLPFIVSNLLWMGALVVASVFMQSEYPSAQLLLSQIPLWERVLRSSAGAYSIYASVEVEYHLFAVITVALGINSPLDWSPPFGELKDCWTIRRTWL